MNLRTVSVLVPHVDVRVLKAGALLRIFDALQLRDQCRLAAGIVPEHQHGFVRGKFGTALGLYFAEDGRPARGERWGKNVYN